MFNAIRNLLHEAAVALCVLNRIQFSAPWNPSRRGC
jgi:hypothetical protein